MQKGIIKLNHTKKWILHFSGSDSKITIHWKDIPETWNDKEVEFILEKGQPIKICCEGQCVDKPTAYIPAAKPIYKKPFDKSKENPKLEIERIGSEKIYHMPASQAPYNFIPLNDFVVRSKGSFKGNEFDQFRGLSGYLDLELETLTHFYIKGQGADSFKVGNDYVLPGSSFRGMIRTLLQIVSWSRFIDYDAQNIYYRKDFNVNKEKKDIENRKPGFLNYDSENKNFIIYKAGGTQSRICENSNNFDYLVSEDCQRIKILTKTVGNSEIYIFENKIINNEDYLIISAEVIKDYLEDEKREAGGEMKNLLDTARSKDNSIIKQLIESRKFDEYKGIPIWYQVELNEESEAVVNKEVNENVIHFGHCKNYRVNNNVKNAIPAKLTEGYKEGEEYDLADSIFGFTGEFMNKNGNKEKHQQSGKVFFEDFYCDNANTEEAILQILASPYPKNGNLYLKTSVNGQAGRWSDDEPRIRGYKLYWNRNTDSYIDPAFYQAKEQVNWQKTKFRDNAKEFRILELNDHEKNFFINDNNNQVVFTKKLNQVNDKKTKDKIISNIITATPQFKAVNALKPRSAFTKGRIRFDNLTEIELGALFFVLQLPELCCFKLGTGKPIGMGSIKLTQCKLTSINRSKRYSKIIKDDGSWNLGESKDDINSINTYIKYFTDFMLSEEKIKNDCSNKSDFWSHPRLQALKKLLTYDTNSVSSNTWLEKTNYMHLSEFKNRGPLPDATSI